jgi:hypothetical protein
LQVISLLFSMHLPAHHFFLQQPEQQPLDAPVIEAPVQAEEPPVWAEAPPHEEEEAAPETIQSSIRGSLLS